MLGYFRLLAAIGVLVGHVSNFLSNGTSRAMVGAFFIVSGYLIAMTVSENYRGRPMAFYRNRFLRVFPTYWLIAGCTALAGAPWWIDYYEALPQGERLMSVFRTFALCFDDARLHRSSSFERTSFISLSSRIASAWSGCWSSS